MSLPADPVPSVRDRPRVVPFGDLAVLACIGDAVDPALTARAHRLAARVRAERAAGRDGLGEPVPGFASVLVPFDPARIDADAARARVADLLADELAADPPDLPAGRLHTIAVRYGGDDGPDLGAVAARLGRTEAEVIALHAATELRVHLLGFAPGFAYLGVLPDALVLPRRAEPRVRVPAGSVAIAGRQAAVYPGDTAGGWHILGRTDVLPWDPARARPALFAPGDRVRFVPPAADAPAAARPATEVR
ncbi:MAG: 5-oxoprolinase subunit PxpB [Chloroflexota bacterium]